MFTSIELNFIIGGVEMNPGPRDFPSTLISKTTSVESEKKVFLFIAQTLPENKWKRLGKALGIRLDFLGELERCCKVNKKTKEEKVLELLEKWRKEQKPKRDHFVDLLQNALRNVKQEDIANDIPTLIVTSETMKSRNLPRQSDEPEKTYSLVNRSKRSTLDHDKRTNSSSKERERHATHNSAQIGSKTNECTTRKQTEKRNMPKAHDHQEAVEHQTRKIDENITEDLWNKQCEKVSKMIRREEFKPLARHLGVAENKVVQIEVDCQNHRLGDPEIVIQILTAWKQMNGREATKEKLMETLEQIERRDIVNKVFAVTSTFTVETDTRIQDLLRIMENQKEYYRKCRLPPPVPWLDFPVRLKEMYVNLEMYTITEDYEEIVGQIQMDEIFENLTENTDPTRILVEGGPGMGKTTFCYKLLNDFGENSPYLADKFKLIFLIFLREIEDGESVEDILKKAYQCNDQWGNQWDKNEKVDILNYIYAYQNEVLLILDGFDELSEEGKRNLVPLLHKEKLRSAFIIVTSRTGMFQINREQNRPEGIMRIKETMNLQIFEKRIVVKGINENDIGIFLRKYFRKISPETEMKIRSFNKGYMREICKCPLFNLLLATMLGDEEVYDIHTKTAMYKCFFNFIIRRSLIREKLLQDDQKIDIFQEDQNDICITLEQFGKLAVENLIRNTLTFREDKILDYCRDKIMLKLGFLTKTCDFETKVPKVFYEPLHKSFLEFLAAYYVFKIFRNSGEDAFKREIRRIVKEGLQPTNDSLFYVFLGGFLNAEAIILFQVLQHFSTWFNLESLCFTNILMEIVDIHSFLDYFLPLLPSFIPSWYSFGGDFHSVGREFSSSPIHSILFNHGLEEELIEVLRWNPSHSIELHRNVKINYLDLYFDGNFKTNDPVFKGMKSLACKTLSLDFYNSFRPEHWLDAIRFIDSINGEMISIELSKGEEGLNTTFFNCLYRELTEGRWKAKAIHRLRFTFTEKDDRSCFCLLAALVRNKKIKDAINIEIDHSERNESEKLQIKSDLEEVFDSVIKSDTIFDLRISNGDRGILPFLNFNQYLTEKSIHLKSLVLCDSLTFRNGNENNQLSVRNAYILSSGDEQMTPRFVQNLQGLKWLWCGMSCFDFLLENNCQILNEIEEITLVCDCRQELNQNIFYLTHLRVLSLEFFGMEETPSICYLKFTPVFTSLRLRIFQLLFIPRDISSFDWLIKSTENSLQIKNEISDFTALEEFVIRFNCYTKAKIGFFWNDLKGSEGMRSIQTMLKKNLVKKFSWVHEYSGVIPRDLSQSLFPWEENFRIKVELYGSDENSSYHSQWDYQWMYITNKFCITYVEE